MTDVGIPSGAKSISVEAIVIRANGTTESLGVVSYWHRNPLLRLWHRLTHRSR